MVIQTGWNLSLALAGFGLLAASLAVQKKALCLVAAGMAVLTVLAVGESDPVLFLGALALAGARLLRTPPKDSPADRPNGDNDIPAGRQP